MKPVWQHSNETLDNMIKFTTRQIERADNMRSMWTVHQYAAAVERLEEMVNEVTIRNSENVLRFYRRT